MDILQSKFENAYLILKKTGLSEISTNKYKNEIDNIKPNLHSDIPILEITQIISKLDNILNRVNLEKKQLTRPVYVINDDNNYVDYENIHLEQKKKELEQEIKNLNEAKLLINTEKQDLIDENARLQTNKSDL